MKTYRSIAELLVDARDGFDFSDFDFVYVDKAKWSADPSQAELFLPSFDEAEEWNDEAGLPEVVVAKGLSSLLATADLLAVIDHFSTRDADGNTEDLIRAIEHYREYDSFAEP